MKKTIILFVALATVCAVTAGLCACSDPGSTQEHGIPSAVNAIHILNTGWEDAIVLESKGHFALIDTGEVGRGAYIVDYLKRLTGRSKITLDFMLITHTHSDHIGGADYIIRHPDVTIKKAYFQDDIGEIGKYLGKVAKKACDEVGVEVIHTDFHNRKLRLNEMSITLFNGGEINPIAAIIDDNIRNIESICSLIEAGGSKALLMADVADRDKEDMIIQAVGGPVDFMKVGHHGLRGSTGKALADAMRPKYAVYTNGSAEDVLTSGEEGFDNLKNTGSAQYVTADNGGVLAVFTNDGMACSAIKEFPKQEDGVLKVERREELTLTELKAPEQAA